MLACILAIADRCWRATRTVRAIDIELTELALRIRFETEAGRQMQCDFFATTGAARTGWRCSLRR